MIEILEEVKQVDDVKEYLSDRFGIKELLQESKMLWTTKITKKFIILNVFKINIHKQ